MTRVKVSAIINIKTIEGSAYMNKKEEYQEIYINLDDSGKLTKKEKVSVYAGIVFLSKQEKDKFITQYCKIINEIKCSYCDQTKGECTKKCKEIKNTNIKKGHKRRIMNYISKYYTIALVINNTKVYDHIISNKASKGRYIDYTIRRLIKSTIEELIKDKNETKSPENRPPYIYQVPLNFIPGVGGKTIEKLLETFENEMNILHKLSEDDVEAVVGSKIASNIIRARNGNVKVNSGGGGNYRKSSLTQNKEKIYYT